MLVASLMAAPVLAVEFSLGDVEGSFNSQLSIGASWRAEGRDSSLISLGNGGSLTEASMASTNGVNDDGNLNFDDGDVFSKVFKGVHDLELRYQNVGVFLRGKYWYDFELKDEDRPWGNVVNGYAADEPLDDDGFNDYAKFSGAELLDAFIYGDFELGDMYLDARAGRQVVSWGESTFIRGGINAINPIDVAAFRRPGAEIKEGLLPVNMLFGNLAITDNFSTEAFYQLRFEPTAIDGCGTYFSTVDYVAEGCNTLTLGSAAATVSPPAGFDDATAVTSGFSVSRAADGNREARDSGQFGLAFRYIAEELNDTEFGVFYLNYHSRTPMVSGIKATAANTVAPATIAPFIPGNTLGGNPQYFTEYPEDISLVGLSFSTNVGEIALSGELSHHRDLPVQINGADLVGAILGASTAASAHVAAVGTGGEVQGYQTFNVSQAQLTAVRFLDQVMGASRVALVGELGYTHMHDFDEADAGGLRFGRPSEFGTSGDDGFVTENSWGYRARAIFTYSDVFSGINLKPSVSWAHDVEGYSPANSSGFVEGRKAVSLALNGDYLNRYTAGISWTRFFGGDFNISKDRDFIAASLGISF